MNWRQISISCDKNLEEEIYSILYRFPISSIEIKDYQDVVDFKRDQPYWVVVDEELNQEYKDIQINTYFENIEGNIKIFKEIKSLLDDFKNRTSYSLVYNLDNLIQDQDWSTEWKKSYKPLKVSERLIIKPTWEKYDTKDNEIVMEIDPGMAFGTGTHETTSLCLKALDIINLKDKSVMDIGCGSGILAIAAILFGASKAYAIDIDPLAIKATTDNGILNNVSHLMEIREEDILETLSTKSKFDVIISNTLFVVLKSFIPKLKDYLSGNGLFLCSGIMEEQKEEMIEALIQENFNILNIKQDGEWISILAEYNHV